MIIKNTVLKKQISLIIIAMIFFQFGNSLWAASKSVSPSAVSKQTKKAEQKRDSAQKNANEAIRKVEAALNSCNSIQQGLYLLQAKQEALSARRDANKTQKAANTISGYANKDGTGAYNNSSEYAQQLAYEADRDASEAEQLVELINSALVELNLSQAELNRLMGEQQGALGELDLAELYLKRAQEADDAYLLAWKEYSKSERRIIELENELQKAAGSDKDMVRLALVNEQKKARELKKVADIKGEFTINAYNQLGEYYDKIGYVGDPVNIGTGEYCAEYVDFLAQDYLEEFSVCRNLCSPTICDSFGNGWTCSLDSRIVQCVFSEKYSLKRQIESAIAECDNMEQAFLRYDKNHPDFPREETSSYLSEANSIRSELFYELREVDLQIAKRNRLLEKNKFCGYGRYKTEESFYGAENQIIYLDETGRQYYFEYQGNGKWTPYGEISKHLVEIYNIDENNERSNSDKNDGGYEVYYFGKSHLFYDKYGILYKKIDRNGNEVSYTSLNGLINKVATKTGEIIHIERNSNGYITKIFGDVSGQTSFTYDGNLLTSVIDNKEIQVNYSYEDNRLSQIKKADNSSISIEYEYSGKKSKYVCSKVKTKNQDYESFEYDYDNNHVMHITNGGKTEIYKLNEYGNPIYEKDCYGNETYLETDENSMIKSVKNNSGTKFFTYDSSFRACEVLSENGGTSYINYTDEKGDQIESYIDADGFKTTYVYDNNGNLIEQSLNDNVVFSYEYYPSGLLKSIKDDEQLIKFDYNKYGSITKKITEKKGKKCSELLFEYDEKNRVSVICDNNDKTEISYGNGIRSELSSHQKKNYYFDKRNRIVKEELLDLITNEKKTIQYEYNDDKLIKVFVDGMLYEENEYTKDDELILHIKWNINKENASLAIQGIEERFVYNSNGNILEYVKQQVKDNIERGDNHSQQISSLEDGKSIRRYKYSSISGNTIVSSNNEMGLEVITTYNCEGKIIKVQYPSGYFVKTVYSKAGRVQQQVDSEYKVWDYIYKSTGFYEVILSTPKGIISRFEYDNKGRLVVYKDILNEKQEYFYDGENCVLIKAKDFVHHCEFDIFGRKITESYKNLTNGKYITDYSIVYDDNLNTVQIVVGKGNKAFIYYQCKLDGFRRPYQVINRNGCSEYKYDSLDRVISKKDGKGNITLYEYDVNNNISYIVFPDNSKRLIKHDVNGFETLIQDGEKIQKRTVYDIDNKKMSVVDCFGSTFDFFYNSEGNVIREKNSKTGEVCYDSNNLTPIKNEIARIEKDICGNVTRITNENSDFCYEYDLIGNIICIEDKSSDSKIEYEYDNFGRCIHQIIDENEMFLTYDLCGNVSEILNAEGLVLVSFCYDELNRETIKEYWNGISEKVTYNKRGLIESKIYRDRIGQIIYCDLLLYDDMDRVIYRIDKEGKITHYSYKDTGQIELIEYPISDELCEYYLHEAIDCGYPLQEKNRESIMYIDSKNFEKMKNLLSKSDVSSFIKILDYQRVWKEEYQYTKHGSISEIKNPLGTILFTYDEHNRIQEKYYSNFSDKKMTFTWNEKGNLEKINGIISKIDFTYGKNNRIEQVDYVNRNNNSRQVLNFEYDGLNRRTRVYNNKYDNQSAVAYMYNGFTNQVIEKYTVFDNGIKNKYTKNDKTSTQLDNTYRYINDESYSAYGTERTDNKENRKVTNSKYVNSNEVNYLLKGENVLSVKNNEYSLQIKDYRNQTQLEVEPEVCNLSYFDAYGNDYSKQYNLLDEITDLGYRDYIPSIKSFTSEDPIRDGNNWYCYCPGDSVNYVDSTGYYIIPIPQTYLMTDEEYVGRFLGNVDLVKYLNDVEYRKKTCTYIDKEGCYITSYANIVAELMRRGIYDNSKLDFSTVEGINSHKEFFHDSLLKRDESGNAIFNSSTQDYDVSWDYFTKEKSGTLRLQIELTKSKVLRDGYAVVGVFDLSQTYSNVSNHMVVLNEVCDENGVFNNITASSMNDNTRLKDKPEEYNIDNLKEIRVIKVENKNCNK